MVAYRFYLDIDGDAEWDQLAAFELVPGGGYVPVMVEREGGRRLKGDQYPGTANVAGARISLTLPLEIRGCPQVIGVRGEAEQTKGGVTTLGASPEQAGAWELVETGCAS